MKLQESGEMYLETILQLSQKSNYVRAIDVSNAMDYSKPSVSRALGLLKNDGYIIVNDASGAITLTEKGLEVATTIYERHQVLTTCLINLGVDPIIAQEDACKIEHDISPESFNALKAHLFSKS